jgi:hypothetical protein
VAAIEAALAATLCPKRLQLLQSPNCAAELHTLLARCATVTSWRSGSGCSGAAALDHAIQDQNIFQAQARGGAARGQRAHSSGGRAERGGARRGVGRGSGKAASRADDR